MMELARRSIDGRLRYLARQLRENGMPGGAVAIALDAIAGELGAPALTALPWRTGRRVGCHLYAQAGPEPSDDDPPIGTLFTAELAAEACAAHNAMLFPGDRRGAPPAD